MSTTATKRNRALTPTPRDAALARESGRRLTPHRRRRLRVELPGRGRSTDTVEVPAVAVDLLVRILGEIAAGNAVTLAPAASELTTQQAADLLNVSRPFLVKLLDGRKIPSRRVGSHRRVLASDVMAYGRRAEAARNKVLAELVADAQDLGGY